MLGKFISFIAGVLTLERHNVRKEYAVDANPASPCQVTLNGKEATFADLQPGDDCTVDGRPAISVKAIRPVIRTPKPRTAPPAAQTAPKHVTPVARRSEGVEATHAAPKHEAIPADKDEEAPPPVRPQVPSRKRS